jgi:nucleoside-diphosphate kinase
MPEVDNEVRIGDAWRPSVARPVVAFRPPPLDAPPAPVGMPLMTAEIGSSETTFALIKTHIVVGSPLIVGEIFWGLMQADVEVAAACRAQLSSTQIETLYNEHLDRPYFPDLVRSVSGEVIAMALRGKDIIGRWRRMLGSTNSLLADAGTLRGEYGSRIVVADNVAHGSDSVAAARRELAHFFPQHLQLWQGA